MRVSPLLSGAALIAAVAAVPGVAAGTAQAAGTHGHVASSAVECAKVKVKAAPGVNTAMIPETIKSKVTSCATATETVILDQHISGPFAARAPMDKKYTITLAPGQTVTKTRHIPYSCCGTYNVRDTVNNPAGGQLAKATTSFTFA